MSRPTRSALFALLMDGSGMNDGHALDNMVVDHRLTADGLELFVLESGTDQVIIVVLCNRNYGFWETMWFFSMDEIVPWCENHKFREPTWDTSFLPHRLSDCKRMYGRPT